MKKTILLILTSAICLFAGQTSLLSSTFILSDNGVANESAIVTVEEVGVQVSPNPFNPVTTISFTGVVDYTKLSLKIYSVAGSLVADLTSVVKASKNSVSWRPVGFASGVYVVRLKVGSTIKQTKVLLVK